MIFEAWDTQFNIRYDQKSFESRRASIVTIRLSQDVADTLNELWSAFFTDTRKEQELLIIDIDLPSKDYSLHPEIKKLFSVITTGIAELLEAIPYEETDLREFTGEEIM